MIESFFSFIQELGIEGFGKIVLLIGILLYAFFAFVVFIQVRSLNKIIAIPYSFAAAFLEGIALLQLLTVLSLFVAALVIL